MTTYIKSTWNEETDATIRNNWNNAFNHIFNLYNYQLRPTTAVEKYYNKFPKDKHNVAATYYHLFEEELVDQAYQMYYSGFNEVNFSDDYANKAKIFFDAFKTETTVPLFNRTINVITNQDGNAAYMLYQAGFVKIKGDATDAKNFYDAFKRNGTGFEFLTSYANSAYKLFNAGFTNADEAEYFYREFQDFKWDITDDEAVTAFNCFSKGVAKTDAALVKLLYDQNIKTADVVKAFISEFGSLIKDKTQIIVYLNNAGFKTSVTGTKLICDEFFNKNEPITQDIANYIHELYNAEFKNPNQIYYLYQKKKELFTTFYTKQQTNDRFATERMNYEMDKRVGNIELNYYQRVEADKLALKIDKNDNKIVMLSIALGVAIAIPAIRLFLHKS
jgi:hypothetical protein